MNNPPDIAMGVDKALEHRSNGEDELDKIGAGDQGMMFGLHVMKQKN